jgi:hypothetical protein
VSASLKSSTDKQKSLVAILAAAGGVAVPVEHLRMLSQSDTVVKDLRGLAALGFVQEEGSSFRLMGELSGTVAKLWDLTAWEDRLIETLVEWLLKKPTQKLLDESVDVLVSSIQKAGEKKRWSQVVSIGRGLERTLILWRRWQTWLDILKLILKAARALGDRKMEAWALHQLGTRAACLGFSESARDFLTGALQIRQAIGDQAGLAVTQNNLNVFFNIPIPSQPGQAQSGFRRWMTCGAVGVVGVAILFGTIIAVAGPSLRSLFTPPQPPVVVDTPVKTVTQIPATKIKIPTITPSSTDNPTITVTPSFTPSHTNTPSHTPSVTPSVTPSRTPTKTPTGSPTSIPDNIGPPAPNVNSPKNNNIVDCSNNPVFLNWIKPFDPSDIEDYNIELLASPNGTSWQWFWLLDASGSTTQLNVASEMSSTCGVYDYYQWRIKANDKAGNSGTWSTWYNFRGYDIGTVD